MIELERIEDLCGRLGLGTMATHLAGVADEAVRMNLSFHEFFERLLQAEHLERQERSRTLLTRTAGFPSVKTTEVFSPDETTLGTLISVRCRNVMRLRRHCQAIS